MVVFAVTMHVSSTLPSGSSPGDGPDPLHPHPPLKRYYASEEERRKRVSRWFDQAAAHYNFITQAMSLGSGHRYRKRALARAGLARGMKVLDVACGTGILSSHAQRIVGEEGLVVGLDLSAGMLRQARRGGVRHLAQGDAELLPVASGQFDFLDMGYALRHVADLRATFQEFRRVLKPGGKILILEITPPRSRFRLGLVRLCLGRVVPMIALLVGGGRGSQELMKYYWDTIETCVAPPVILAALREAGFSSAERHVELGIFSEYLAAS
jgi:demethylmenaquinone methyltransferase/2-methoxy-6-polyprenyl-1,4-benzoquinol methylase